MDHLIRHFALSLFIACFIQVAKAQENDLFLNKVDSFFSKYVHNGHIDYEGIISNQIELDRLINYLNLIDIKEVPDEHRKALLINTYNLLVINAVVSNYPIQSPLQVKNFFTDKNHSVFGKKLSLNMLEKELIFKEYKDPRMHFALICAAEGCPKIQKRAYRSEMLEDQLNSATRSALNDPKFIIINNSEKKVYVSQIFNWYKDHFRPDIPVYINMYRSSSIPVDYEIAFYEYQWELNNFSGKNYALLKSELSDAEKMSYFFIAADAFLKKYVSRGNVNTIGINDNPFELRHLMKFIQSVKIDNLEEKTLKAFYINAYNLTLIHSLIENSPVNTPDELEKYFEKASCKIANKKVSLNVAEQNILFGKFKDPRLHLVLAGPAKGCPPFISYAITPEKIEDQLLSAISSLLNNKDFLWLDPENKKVKVSKVFEIYKADFGDNLIAFINRYVVEKIPGDYTIEYYHYDWNINLMGTEISKNTIR